MIDTVSLGDGITLRAYRDTRFHQGRLSVQLVRRMRREEAAVNALLPAVLLRGTAAYADLRALTRRLDELYGASVGTLVRRVGDYQTTGLYCAFLDDRFAADGAVLAPLLELVRELLRAPRTAGDGFLPEFVESEKKNLMLAIESRRNDKRVYAMSQLLARMCRADSFGVERLGDVPGVQAVTPEGALAHYRKILRESRVELFYVGSQPADAVARLCRPLLAGLERAYAPLPPQTPFHDAGGTAEQETLPVAQGRLCMGFTTPISAGSADYAAMQLVNTAFGGGQTARLYQNVRERMSACYEIGSAYYGTKGILTVSAGIDSGAAEAVRAEVLHQLAELQSGRLTDAELACAREELLSALRASGDSPGAIENYYATGALSGVTWMPEEYAARLLRVTAADVARAAGTLRLHSEYQLREARV